MKRWKIWAAGLALFCSGVLVGTLGGNAMLLHRGFPGGFPGGPPGFPPGPPEKHVVKMLEREFDLTDEQIERIRPIVMATAEQMRVLHKEIAPRAKAIFDATAEKIKAELTGEQKKKFEEHTKKMREHREKFLEGGPPPEDY